MNLKNLKRKAMRLLIAIIPVITIISMNISANTLTSPRNGQPAPPKTIRKYRKF